MNMRTHTLRLTAMLLFMALCVAAGAATDKGKGMVSLTLTDEPLPSALKKIERQGGKSILFTYGETERYRVTAAIRGKTQAEAIAAVLDGKPFSFVERDIYFVVQYNADKARTVRVTGRVTDAKGSPLAFATVMLLTKAGNRYVTGCATADDGTFVLPAMPQEPCLLKVSFVGYETATVDCRRDNRVTLKADSRLLKEVVVDNKRPMIERRGGNILANVAGSPLALMGTADEMISHLPFVSGGGGSFNVIGRGSALILINGKTVRDAGELQRLQADEILSAEIVMNPGARYASTVGAVIRIKTIRQRGQGLSGSLYANGGQGRCGYANEGVALNYRVGGLDVFARAHFNEEKTYVTSTTNTTLWSESVWRTVMSNTTRKKSAHFNGDIGFNYEIDDRQSFGMRYAPSRNIAPFETTGKGTTEVYRDDGLIERSATVSTVNYHPRWNHSLNAYYTATFGKWGIDFNADYYKSSSRTSRQTAYDGAVDAESGNKVDNDLYAARLVISRDFENTSFAVGTEETFTDRRDRFVQSGFSADADDHLQQAYYSAFADFTAKFGKFNVRAGLRYEHQRTRYYEAGEFKSGQSPVYNDLMPSASVDYQNGPFSLSLAYRMTKYSPSYDMLSSATNYVNKYHYRRGDPHLVPQKHHTVTLNGGWKWINFNLWYDYVLDMYTSYFKPYDEEAHPGVMLDTHASIPYTNVYGGAVSLMPQIGPWMPNLQASISWYDTDASCLGITKHWNEPQIGVSLDNNFMFNHGWFVNLNGYYRFHSKQSYGINKPYGVVNLRIVKSFLKDLSLKVALGVKDVFHTNDYRFIVYGDRTYYDLNSYNDSQRITLSVNYTFNATKSKYRGKGAGQAEKQRL